uniref:Uncharacterized protein n=1 Tax=Tanacetum cinerariifolium TaxID=118510 RepID=A0A6L2NCA0_TANCI|nr:hypothetical protein [Tanacetum cinerariifolium]
MVAGWCLREGGGAWRSMETMVAAGVIMMFRGGDDDIDGGSVMEIVDLWWDDAAVGWLDPTRWRRKN